MNKRHPRWTAGLLLSLLGAGLWAVFAFGAGQSNNTYTIDRDVISAGGQLSESPVHQLVGTIGQASAIGQSENTLHINYGGFWKEDGTSSPTYYTLKIQKTGDGNGTVKTLNETGIDCGTDCTEQYQEGSSISLIATPDADSTFGGWFVNDNPVTAPITVNQDITVTAKFILKPTPTPTPVPTNTPTPVPTATPVPTNTPTPVPTNTPTPVPTSTPTPVPTNTPTPVPTNTPTPTPTPTPTSTNHPPVIICGPLLENPDPDDEGDVNEYTPVRRYLGNENSGYYFKWVNYYLKVEDPDGDSLTVKYLSLPPRTIIENDGTLVLHHYVDDYDDCTLGVHSYTFNLEVSDGQYTVSGSCKIKANFIEETYMEPDHCLRVKVIDAK